MGVAEFVFTFTCKSVLVKIQAFTINGSDGACEEACFYLRAMVVCF